LVIFINDDDIKLLSESRTSVAHNIISNLILSSGIAPIEKLMLENICVGIGTDGPGTNDGLDLLADLKCAALAQKYATGNPNCLTTETLLRMATQYGAEAIGLSNQLGSIEAGKLADIILIDFNKAKFTPSHFNDNLNILSHLVYVATGEDVDTVIVGGEILVENRQLIGIKIDEIISKAQKSSEKILNAIVN
jgi:5-methylthioadenosine/S-adenosylhomocysteine deaminase